MSPHFSHTNFGSRIWVFPREFLRFNAVLFDSVNVRGCYFGSFLGFPFGSFCGLMASYLTLLLFQSRILERHSCLQWPVFPQKKPCQSNFFFPVVCGCGLFLMNSRPEPTEIWLNGCAVIAGWRRCWYWYFRFK